MFERMTSIPNRRRVASRALRLSLVLTWTPVASQDTIVVLIDFQKDFAASDGAWPADRALGAQTLDASARLARTARERNWRIVRVANAFSPKDRIANWFRKGAAIAGSPGARLVPPFDTLPGPLFEKANPSAFESMPFRKWMDDRGTAVLWVAGYFAHGCVAATALDALERGHVVLSHPSLVASPDSGDWRKGWSRMRKAGVRESGIP